MSYYGNSSYPPSGGSGGGSSHQQGYAGGQAGGYSYDGSNYSTNQWQNQQSSQQQQQQHHQLGAVPQYNQWQPHHQAQDHSASQSSSMISSQQQYQHQMGASQQQQHQGGWDPSVAAAMAASAFTSNQFPTQMAGQMVTDMGTSFLRESWAKMIPGLEAFLLTLRAYFAVDNKYVLQKIKTILFPFLKKDWRRNLKGYGGPDGSTPMYDLPIADENAPDLYLPFMSLITYVLLAALVYGNAGKFNPEVIPDVTTKCFVTQLLEVLLMRLGIYVLLTQQQSQYPQAPVQALALLDLLSYTGYKYLGLSVNMLFGLIANHFGLGARVYYGTFLWTASAASYFMLKTMLCAVPGVTQPHYGGNEPVGSTNRQVMVLVFAAAQFATMWFVSQTKNL